MLGVSSPLPHSGGKIRRMSMSNADRRTARRVEAAQGRTGGTGSASPVRRSAFLRRTVTLLVLLGGLGAVAGGAGFLAFTAQIAAREPAAVRPADAIVVLTGGSSRIVDAVGLLAEGRGRRLLITGVNPATSADEMRRSLPDGEHLMSCCIDLGHKALNTRGNALEAAEWARSRSFRSLVVVTSSWHMPRAMMELGRALPEVDLVAYPVVTNRMQAEVWWKDLATVRLLAKEYAKFIMAAVKIRPARAVVGMGEPGAPAPASARPPSGPAASGPAASSPAAPAPAPSPSPPRGSAPAPVQARIAP